ncbi:diaminopimelate epimerase [Fusobacterium varium]|mgnify:FL=1|uniref:diaminopimelate epimerase n=1 Tax=Fusobacterium varium TaxID=856 RepID=UPI000E40E21E|nr:diaminopimelate epimerase [Fusobacterium varium]MCI6031883.1 diaminopimelate epimerase [Fusobacterium varium]MDY4005080.1 diaminopimelate epimerase [Fusobacterium varium]RGJ30347.1 diaminopimelate epimerase [Fusobacterium varium]
MKFSKMQAAGNDFILVNGMIEKSLNWNETAKKVCDRHFGIGADGLMFCESSSKADIKMHYYNSDGSRGEMCGNGIRCFAKFIYDNGIVKKEKFSVETDAGIKYIKLDIGIEGNIEYLEVDMGKIDFRGKKIPCTIQKETILEEEIFIENKKIVFSSVLMGVPHTTIFVENFDEYDVNEIGSLMEKNDIFPEKTNVNFAKIITNDTIMIKTWERGAGRTLGCGTGCCATAALAYKLGKIKKNKIKLLAEGGELFIEIGENYEITMSGKAETICHGEFLK